MTHPAPTAPILFPEHIVRQRLAVSRTTFWRLQRAGEAPPAVNIGSRRFYRPSDLEAWLESRTVRAA